MAANMTFESEVKSNNNEPVHEISKNVVCATSKASDQPAHTCSLIRTFASRLSKPIIVKQLTGHLLEFLSLKGGCRDSSESTLVKMSNCWKSHGVAQYNQAVWLQMPTLLTF